MDQPPTVQGNLLRHPITAFKIHLKMTQKNTQLFHTKWNGGWQHKEVEGDEGDN